MRAFSFCTSIALALAICEPSWGAENTGPLPPPPPEAAPHTGAARIVPFERLGAQDGSIRTVFQGPGPGNTNIQIRDVIVGPKAVVRLDPSKGPAVIDTRSGEGSLKVGDRTVRLDIADVVSAAPGLPLELQSTTDAPLVLIIYVVEGR